MTFNNASRRASIACLVGLALSVLTYAPTSRARDDLRTVQASEPSAIDAAGDPTQATGRGWSWSMRLRRWGRAGGMVDVPAATPKRHAQRWELAHAGGLTEWYERASNAVEQGFEVEVRAAGEGPLRLEIGDEDASLRPAMMGRAVALRDAAGVQRATYGALAVLDDDGRSVPAQLTVEGARIAIEIDDAHARYPLHVDPKVVGGQIAELHESTSGLGFSVDYDGTSAIAGAPYDASEIGAAYLYVPSGSTWGVGQKIVGTDSVEGDEFGWAVSVSGGTAVVSAVYGHGNEGVAYVFTASGTRWSQSQVLTDPTAAMTDYFGQSVALTSDTLFVGAIGVPAPAGAAGGGLVHVYAQSGTQWTHASTLSVAGAHNFGSSVSIDGDSALITAPSTRVAGSAYVFTRSGSNWSQQATLTSGAATTNDLFGVIGRIQGDTAVVGAAYDSAQKGAVYVYSRTGVSWSAPTKLVAPDGAPGDEFGYALALDGDDLLVGAQSAIGQRGTVYSFHRTTDWTLAAELTASDAASDAFFGSAVALHSGTGLVGAHAAGAGAHFGDGAVYVFAPADAIGDACTAGTDCAGGRCTDGVCCTASECGTCGTCAGSTPGECGPKPIGATPSQACDLYACDGTSTTCPLACTGDLACIPGGKCDATSATCVAGARCSADGTSAYDSSGHAVSCGLYVCGADGTCPTTCTDSSGCQGGSVCSESACVVPATGGSSSGGCTWSKRSAPASDPTTALLFGGVLGVVLGRRRRRTKHAVALAISSMTALGLPTTAQAGTVLGGQQAKLTGDSIELGWSVAFDGATIFGGDPNYGDELGAAFVFPAGASSGATPVLLQPNDPTPLADFGWALAVSGDHAIVAAPKLNSWAGKVYFFTQTGGAWTQTQSIVDPAGGQQNDDFGIAVAMSGTTAIVGADGVNGGSAYVYTLAGTTWTLQTTLTVADGGGFGVPIVLDGDTFAASAGGTGAGSVYVFARSGTTWTQQAHLTVPGSSFFGSSLAISGDRLIASAPYESQATGAAYVYARTGSTWAPDGRLAAPEGVAGDAFGAAVAIAGDAAVVTADFAATGAGRAYSFSRSTGAWLYEATMRADDAAAGDTFGSSLAMSGTTVVIGDDHIPSGTDTSGIDTAGALYVFAPAPANGSMCSSASQCASDFCVDGVCCASSACGSCGTCAGSTPGTCAPKPLGSTPSATCGAFVCSGSDTSCPVACAGDAACVGGSHCDPVSHQCVSGAYCSADRLSSIDASGTPTSCGGYLCSSGGACATTCADSSDCAGGYICNEASGGAACVPPASSSSSGGCAMGVISVPAHAAWGVALSIAAAIARRRRARR